jgi:ankyrin repeat protein
VDLLLERGADINARNKINGKTCLHAAGRSLQLDSGLIGHLLDKGADPTIVVRLLTFSLGLSGKSLTPKMVGSRQKDGARWGFCWMVRHRWSA